MINQNEIRRIAGSLGVDPMIVNHDYVLGCFLHYLSLQDSLARCHFANYRFFEYLDFTVLSSITELSI